MRPAATAPIQQTRDVAPTTRSAKRWRGPSGSAARVRQAGKNYDVYPDRIS
jgi:hypothetical protein